MPHRSASPALSENAFDITGSLIPDGDFEDVQKIKPTVNRKRKIGEVEADTNGIILDFENDDGDEAFFATQQVAANKAKNQAAGGASKKSGGFQSMGISPQLLKAVTRKGFSVPTPIQRRTIPLILDGRDVVGMARTGSGKTAAFVLPMIEKLKSHSVTVGARAIVLSPSRELALQTLKTVKEFGKGTDLRTVLLVGGDSFEEQFNEMTANPDIIIATPGRFLHLLVEMRLELSTIRYVVFDEADRLFEMGFAVQLNEILHALPPSRQSLLFSATLPASLVEFAKAGLQDPVLIRLDAESKMSPDLENAFLNVKSSDKEGALMHILQDLIKMPAAETLKAQAAQKEQTNGKKRKRDVARRDPQDSPTEHSTVIFAATKHHVEYLANLLRASGFAISYVYGSLDQTARQMQVESFRAGETSVLIVTDVAARGIDIPMLANVINYDFPAQPKLFLHRVGRTARAGRKGWSYNLVQSSDMPYLLDLQLFLSKKLVCGWSQHGSVNFAEDMVLGSIPTPQLERNCEAILKLLDEIDDLSLLRDVALKGEKLYLKTRSSASAESVKRSKERSTLKDAQEPNMLYIDSKGTAQTQREEMLSKIGGFRPNETVFEFGKKGVVSETTEAIKRRREKMQLQKEKDLAGTASTAEHSTNTKEAESTDDIEASPPLHESEDELEVVLPDEDDKEITSGNTVWQDSENFMGYAPRNQNLVEERGYGVRSGTDRASNFADAARDATMNLVNDETKSFGEASKPRQMRWDKRSKNYVATVNDEDGSKGKKLVRGESGQKIAASFRSGIFDDWKKHNRIDLPRTGEAEMPRSGMPQQGRKRFKHYAERAPKQPDRYRDDYHEKKKKFDEVKKQKKENGITDRPTSKPARSGLRSVEDIHKARKLQARRKEKNARPSKRKA